MACPARTTVCCAIGSKVIHMSLTPYSLFAVASQLSELGPSLPYPPLPPPSPPSPPSSRIAYGKRPLLFFR
eukprot:12348481-Prorocentrum_lima.AAC.1